MNSKRLVRFAVLVSIALAGGFLSRGVGGVPGGAEDKGGGPGPDEFTDDVPLRWADAFHDAMVKQCIDRGVGVVYGGALGREAFSMAGATGWRGPFPGNESGQWHLYRSEENGEKITTLFDFRLRGARGALPKGSFELRVAGSTRTVEVSNIEGGRAVDVEIPKLRASIADFLKAAAVKADEAIAQEKNGAEKAG